MTKNSRKTRRDFLKTAGTAGTAGITGLAGCNTLDGDNSDQDDETDTSTSTPEPSYSIQASPLQYDLTSLATSEANTHDENYVEDNYSAELGITVLENGEEKGLEELGDFHLETQDGEEVETTEDGYVPEYAVEDGEELTVRAEVDGEMVQDSVTVSKNLPDNFLVDASLVEEGDVLYETPWSTPYQFDNHTTDRQEFLQRRNQERNERAEDNAVERIDTARIKDRYEELRSQDLSDREVKRETLREVRKAVQGSHDPEIENVLGIEPWNADAQAINEELVIDSLDFLPYEEVYIGGIYNPAGPDIETEGSYTKGNSQTSKVAYVDGDWYHVSSTLDEVKHVDDIHEIFQVSGSSSTKGALSVLGEFEKGEMEGLQQREKIAAVNNTVKSPPTVSNRMSGPEESFNTFPVSWSALESIRRNENWDSFMPQIEMAIDHGMRETGSEEKIQLDNGVDEVTESATVTIGEGPQDMNLLRGNGRDIFTEEGKEWILNRPDFQDSEDIRREYLS